MVFCNQFANKGKEGKYLVTILILIDGFLQLLLKRIDEADRKGHNPYFNRWFSAINSNTEREHYLVQVTILILIDGFLQ